jgi:hypothetical protein
MDGVRLEPRLWMEVVKVCGVGDRMPAVTGFLERRARKAGNKVDFTLKAT